MRRKTKRLTMQDIADRLGVSRVIVSSVMNNRARERGCGAATEKRIRSYFARHGYVPSRHAVGLRVQRQEVVGLLHSGDLFSHLIAAFNRIVGELARKPEGFELVVTRHDKLLEGLQDLISRGVSRLVWFHTLPGSLEQLDPDRMLPYLRQFERVIIYNYDFTGKLWSRPLAAIGAHLVGVDRREGYERLGRFLKNLGHSKIIECTLAPDYDPGQPPSTPVLALRNAGLHLLGGRPPGVPYAQTPEFGQALARVTANLCRTHGATALYVNDDEIAGYTMVELLRLELRIPQDLTVVGFDGMPFGGALVVPLTTLAVPIEAMATRVLELLEKPTVRTRHCFPLEILERASHGPAPSPRALT